MPALTTSKHNNQIPDIYFLTDFYISVQCLGDKAHRLLAVSKRRQAGLQMDDLGKRR